MPIVILRCQGGEEVLVPQKTLKMYQTIQDQLESSAGKGPQDDAAMVIELPDIQAPIMRVIFEWCAHHVDDEDSEQPGFVMMPDTGIYDVSDWDNQFLKAHEDVLHKIKKAAAILQIDKLEKVVLRVFYNIHLEWSNRA